MLIVAQRKTPFNGCEVLSHLNMYINLSDTVDLMILLLNLNSDSVRLRVMFVCHAIFSLRFN